MENPLVSIMIPTYNQEKYITQAVESALNQTYSNLEIIVCDDKSNYNIKETLVPYMKNRNLKVIQNNKNLGRVGNYHNILYYHVNGDYAVNLDGDDRLIDRNYIKDVIMYFSNNPDISLCFAKKTEDEKDIDDTGKVTSINGTELVLNYWKKKYELNHLTSVYNVEKAKETGFYNLDIISSDLDSLLRYSIGEQICFIDRTVGYWRRHSTNESCTANIEDRLNNLKYTTTVYNHLQKKGISDQIAKKWYRIMLSYRIYSNYVSVLNKTDKEQANIFLLKAIKNFKHSRLAYPYNIKLLIKKYYR